MRVCKRVPKTAHEIISYQLYMLFLIHHSILLEKFLLTCIDVLWLLTKSYLKDMLFFVKEKRFVKSLILIKRLFLYDFGNGFLWNLATLQWSESRIDEIHGYNIHNKSVVPYLFLLATHWFCNRNFSVVSLSKNSKLASPLQGFHNDLKVSLLC